jgi:aminoglycoside phosphotransferase (APT) family kinase protein
MADGFKNPDAALQSLTRWMAARLSEPAGPPVTDLQLAFADTPEHGQSNATVLFSADWSRDGVRHEGRYVVRLQSADNQIFPDPDVLREFRVLEALRAIGTVPVPRVFWSEDDPAWLGQPFFVMEQVDGIVANDKPSIHAVGWLAELREEQRTQAWRSAMDALIAIHAVDWRRSHGFLVGTAGVGMTVADHVERLTSWYRWATAGRAFPVTDAALEHLRDRRADVGRSEPVLLWGDARTGNIIFAEDCSVAAVIDWEFASIGPPEIDLGWWLMMDEYLTVASGIERLAGFPDEAATIGYYEARRGHALADLDYYRLLGALTMATTLIRIADIGVAKGRFPAGTRIGQGNIPAQMIARQLGLPVPELDPEERARRRLDTIARH